MVDEQQDEPEAPEPDVDENGDCTVCENERELCCCTRCEFCAAVANEENWRVCGGCMHTFQRYWDAENGFARARVTDLEQRLQAATLLLNNARDAFAAGPQHESLPCRHVSDVPAYARWCVEKIVELEVQIGRRAANARCEHCADPVHCPSCAEEAREHGHGIIADETHHMSSDTHRAAEAQVGGTELKAMSAGDPCLSCGWQLHEHFSGNLACDKCGTHFPPAKKAR